MPYIPPEVVSKAKQMDLYTYLKTYEPQELVHFGGSTYCTREHDSLKISNGKWYWFSRGIGGRSALDYLIKVKGIPFMEAVEVIVGRGAIPPPAAQPAPKVQKAKSLCLPEASRCATHAVNYLAGRGIDCDLLDFCFATGWLYESQKYHNVVFVGLDKYGNLNGKHVQIAQDTTKTKSSMRTLPLVPALKEKLLAHKKQQDEYRRVCGKCYDKRYLDYICVDEMGTLISPHYLTSAFPKLLDKNGLRHIRFHDLRHSCASLLLSNGVPMKQIQEWLGHSDFSTTANVYAHLDYNSKLSSADAMVNGLKGALSAIQ